MQIRPKCANNFLASSITTHVKFIYAINKNLLSKAVFTRDEGPIYQQDDMEENMRLFYGNAGMINAILPANLCGRK